MATNHDSTDIVGSHQDTEFRALVFHSTLQERRLRTRPLKALDKPEPIADAKGSLTKEELTELVKRFPPPASWFEQDEEQLF